jgi:hypothetical protein
MSQPQVRAIGHEKSACPASACRAAQAWPPDQRDTRQARRHRADAGIRQVRPGNALGQVLEHEIVSLRNFLAHRYFRERASAFMSAEGRDQMIAELDRAVECLSIAAERSSIPAAEPCSRRRRRGPGGQWPFAGFQPRAGATSVAMSSRARMAASWSGTAGLNCVIRSVATGSTFSSSSAAMISSGWP